MRTMSLAAWPQASLPRTLAASAKTEANMAFHSTSTLSSTDGWGRRRRCAKSAARVASSAGERRSDWERSRASTLAPCSNVPEGVTEYNAHASSRDKVPSWPMSASPTSAGVKTAWLPSWPSASASTDEATPPPLSESSERTQESVSSTTWA